jgi:hypothetical protein
LGPQRERARARERKREKERKRERERERLTSQQHNLCKEQEEDLELIYDPILNCYWDPQNNKYYELKNP